VNRKSLVDSNTVVVGGINNPLLPIDSLSSQKINKEIIELKDTIDLMDLTDVYRIFHLQQHNIHSSQQPMEISAK
jgi:hypothetical protein